MPKPKLPVDLQLGDRTQTAYTANEYVNLIYRGFTVVEDADADLSPAEKAARTRAANKAKSDEETSNVPVGTPVPAGDAN